ncbi:hypothetical protein SVIOM74S_10093 [Streptomyces violarus]
MAAAGFEDDSEADDLGAEGLAAEDLEAEDFFGEDGDERLDSPAAAFLPIDSFRPGWISDGSSPTASRLSE